MISKDAEYTGMFKENLYHGEGSIEYSNGNSYEGEFEGGVFHGLGSFVASGGHVYKGEFVGGEFNGHGTYEYDQTKYTGGFKDWVYDGPGTLLEKEGDKYTGTFELGSLDGEGEHVSADGDHYEGEFEASMYHGQGKLVTARGDVYEGGFRYGRYHGRGMLTYAKPVDGKRQVSGRWDHGSLVESDDPNALVDPEALTEITLYNQNDLLRQLAEQVQQNDPNEIDLYFLGIAGDGLQGVFLRELTYIKNYFDAHLGTRGKSVALINSMKTVKKVPLATKTSVKAALHAIVGKTDPLNDILFIYMTSHGSREFELSLKQSGLKLADLSAQYFADLLATIPIRWKVIVISACYSGGFIPKLEDEHTMIITAAAADKRSFGCSDDADFTYFGEAFSRMSCPQPLISYQFLKGPPNLWRSGKSQQALPSPNPRSINRRQPWSTCSAGAKACLPG